jgi:hypothetical protein
VKGRRILQAAFPVAWTPFNNYALICIMQNESIQNTAMEFATKFIQQSNKAVFLTGKAGTGKTTFLKDLKTKGLKQTVIVAPTGVAAINAGGTTIHSFFQLPFGPFIPARNFHENPFAQNAGKYRLTAEKKWLMQSMNLLVIDEVSMVRADTLDSIDAILRYLRKQPSLPFGGVQILYIGDMYQLPPVIKDDEWKLLQPYYNSAYFFSSKVFAEQPPVYIELEKVYRQKDQAFINLLNKVRSNEMDEEGYELLQSRYQPSYEPEVDDFHISLTTHNHKADATNALALEKIKQAPRFFKADVKGDFPENAYPAEAMLCLKIGARVMFLRNDTEKIRRYYNGKIGVVEKIDEDQISIRCEDSTTESIQIKREVWENNRYLLNQKTRQLEEQSIGSFTQFPLRLAWAITIHKSQGLTFNKAIIDAGQAFTAGQVYVALSRCSSLEGLLLKSRITIQSLLTDPRIVEFTQNQKRFAPDHNLLHEARRSYQQQQLLQCFHFEEHLNRLKELEAWTLENQVFEAPVAEWLNYQIESIKPLIQYASRFSLELKDLFISEELPDQNPNLQDRISKASLWFDTALEKVIASLKTSPADTDNRLHAIEFDKRMNIAYEKLCEHQHILQAIRDSYHENQYQEALKWRQMTPLGISAYSAQAKQFTGELKNAELFLQLQEKRNELAAAADKAIYMICSTESLKLMAEFLPVSATELKKIKGFGEVKVKQFGTIFLEIIESYCTKHDIPLTRDMVPEKRSKKARSKKNSSAIETLSMFKEGKSIPDIMALRKLARSTIEEHLGLFLETGELSVDALMNEETQALIKIQLQNPNLEGLKMIKEKLPENISYSNIRWMLAAMKKETLGAKIVE